MYKASRNFSAKARMMMLAHLREPGGQLLRERALLGTGVRIVHGAQVVAGTVKVRPQPDGALELDDALAH